MPYHIEKRGDKHCVTTDDGKVVKAHDSRARALRHLRALYANVPEAKEDVVRTPAGAKKYKKPIGAPILTETARHRNYSEHDVQNHGIEIPNVQVTFRKAEGGYDTHKISVVTRTPGPMSPDPSKPSKYDFRKDVGHMLYNANTGRVEGISVAKEHQRQGIGTAMWDLAKRLHEHHGTVHPKHSETQYEEGAAWAKAVGKDVYGGMVSSSIQRGVGTRVMELKPVQRRGQPARSWRRKKRRGKRSPKRVYELDGKELLGAAQKAQETLHRLAQPQSGEYGLEHASGSLRPLPECSPDGSDLTSLDLLSEMSGVSRKVVPYWVLDHKDTAHPKLVKQALSEVRTKRAAMMTMTHEVKFDDLRAALETKVRRVASAEGERRFHLPKGSIIKPGVVGELPAFRPTKMVVHHSEGGDRVIVTSAGPVKQHVQHFPDKDTANEHLDAIEEAHPHLVHLFHNIRGRMYRQTGDQVHAQMADGSFVHVGDLDYNARDQVIAKPNARWAKKQNMVTRGKAHPSIKEAMEYLANGVDMPKDGTPFRMTKQLREILNSPHNKHMRALKEGEERKTSDGQPIPPAWTQVEVAKDPGHILQARGRDDLGRLQPLYAKKSRDSGLVAKHERGRKVATAMPKLDKALTRQALMNDDTAAAVYFMRHTGARVDSQGDQEKTGVAATAKGIQAFGTTSLQAQHVKVSGNTVKVRYIGKNGMENTYEINNKNFADAMRKRLAGKKPTDRVFNTNAAQTAAFIKQHLGVPTDRPNHDLRTHYATGAAAEYIHDISPDEYPTSEREHKRLINQIGDHVGGLINDTRSVTLGSYIDPAVLAPLRKNLD